MIIDDFAASIAHVGDICFLCGKEIKIDQPLRFYGGPYIMHGFCVDKLIDPHGAHEPKEDK